MHLNTGVAGTLVLNKTSTHSFLHSFSAAPATGNLPTERFPELSLIRSSSVKRFQLPPSPGEIAERMMLLFFHVKFRHLGIPILGHQQSQKGAYWRIGVPIIHSLGEAYVFLLIFVRFRISNVQGQRCRIGLPPFGAETRGGS